MTMMCNSVKSRNWLQRVNKGSEMKDDEIFNRKCAGDEREYTPEEEEQIKKEALKEVELLRKMSDEKKNEGSK